MTPDLDRRSFINIVIARATVLTLATLKETAAGKSVANFSVLLDECSASIRITAWDKLAQAAITLKVGESILIQGKLSVTRYTKGGRECRATEIIAVRFEPLTAKETQMAEPMNGAAKASQENR